MSSPLTALLCFMRLGFAEAHFLCLRLPPHEHRTRLPSARFFRPPIDEFAFCRQFHTATPSVRTAEPKTLGGVDFFAQFCIRKEQKTHLKYTVMNNTITLLRDAIEAVSTGRWAFARIDNGNGNIVQFKTHAPNELYVETTAPYWGDVEAQKRALKRLGFTPSKSGSLIAPDDKELSDETIYANWVNVADVRPFAEEILYIFNNIFDEELGEFTIHSDEGVITCNADKTMTADTPATLPSSSSQPATDPHEQECNALRDQLRKVLVWQQPSVHVDIDKCMVAVESPVRDSVYIKAVLQFAPDADAEEQMRSHGYTRYGNEAGIAEFRKLTTFSDANQLFNEIKFIFERVCHTEFARLQLSESADTATGDSKYDIFIQHSAEQTLQQALQRVGNHTWRSAVIVEPKEIVHINDNAIDVNLSIFKPSQRTAAADKLRRLGYTQSLFGNLIAKRVDLSRADTCRELAKELIDILENICCIDSRLLIMNYVDADEGTRTSGFALSAERVEVEYGCDDDNESDDKVATKSSAPERHDATTKYRDMYKEDNKEGNAGCTLGLLAAFALFLYTIYRCFIS